MNVRVQTGNCKTIESKKKAEKAQRQCDFSYPLTIEDRSIMAEKSNHEEKEIIEEDWSAVMNLGFARHERKIVNIDQGQSLEFECVSCLSPLDMMNLSNGLHDATGHKLWMGAYMFIEGVIRQRTEMTEKNGFDPSLLFANKRVLELGCGTGVAGLALYYNKHGIQPSWLTLTDSDPETIELCKTNFNRNLKEASSAKCAIGRLVWGESRSNAQLHQCTTDSLHGIDVAKGETKNKCSSPDPTLMMYDTVMATDVLYDIASLEPLLKTTKSCLKKQGYFTLSHVPRASLEEEVSTTDERLEAHITKVAASHGLAYCAAIRPRDLARIFNGTALNSFSFEEMENIGAAILVYQKCSPT